MVKEMKESQYKQGDNSSFCKCLLFSSSDLDIEPCTVTRSRKKYNFIFIHQEIIIKQRKETVSISREYMKEEASRSALCFEPGVS